MNASRPVAMHLARVFTDRGRRAERYVFPAGDFDTSRPGGRRAAQDQAAHLAALANSCGIPAVLAESGPSGGRHVWMACPEGVEPVTVRRLARAAAALWPTFDGTPLFNPISGALRPPGAAHRHGGRSRLISHTLDEALELLTAGAPAAAFAALAEVLETLAEAAGALAEGGAADPEPGHEVVPPSIAYGADGRPRPVVHAVTTDEAGRPRLAAERAPLAARPLADLRRQLAPADDHSSHAHRVLRQLAAAGYAYEDAAALAESAPGLEYLRTARAPGGRQQRDTDERAALWPRLWWLAVQDAARTPKPIRRRETGAYAELAAAVADLLNRAEAAGPARWARQSGPADLACLRAVMWLMLESGAEDVSAPCRRLGVLMGYHHSTAALAMDRLVRDGWLVWMAEPLPDTRTAGRLAIATMHQCTDDEHHMCALYALPSATDTPGQSGSDRRRNAAAPPSPRTLRTELAHHLTHHQGDVWHTLGHHAARTHDAITHGTRSPHELAQVTGYTLTTITSHLTELARVGLVAIVLDGTGARVVPTGRTLDSAAQHAAPTVVGRTAWLAAQAVAAAYACDWWAAEVAWCRADRAEKRRRGRRAPADQELIPQPGRSTGPDPRAYPRKADGSADHHRARILAGARVNAAALYAHARQLAQAGQLIDPGTLARQTAAAAA